jgi:hypothetical protein
MMFVYNSFSSTVMTVATGVVSNASMLRMTSMVLMVVSSKLIGS